MTAPGEAARRPLPPVAQAAAVALALLFSGGIYLAAHLPSQPSLVPAVVLLLAAAAILAVSVIVLARRPDFAWHVFLRVGGWTLLAYIVIAGMLEYVFVRNGTRGAPLVVMTLMLVVFALSVSVAVAFTVARYESPEG